jgi:hypothetical protein
VKRRLFNAGVLVSLALAGAGGCSGDKSPTVSTTGPSTQATQEGWHLYDDPRFSADERQAVRAATKAVLHPDRPPPDFDQAFRYLVSKVDGDWVVLVWSVTGFKDGQPQFVPGGFTGVTLDSRFRVKSQTPGT